MLALASGVPLVLLGAALLALRPRTAQSAYFGGFAALWGLQIVVANVGHVIDAPPGTYARLLLTTYALAAPATLFLVHVSARTALARGAGLVTFAAGVVIAAASATLLLRPEWVVAGVEAGADGALVHLGPATVPLFIVPFFGAFYLGVLLLDRAYRAAPAGSTRQGVRGLLVALSLFASYATVWSLATVARMGEGASLPSDAAAGGFAFLFLAGAAILGAVLVRHLLDPPPPGERDRGVVVALALPAAVAVLEAVLGASGATLGLWRLAAVAVLVHALARHRLFDLDLRLKSLAGPAVAALALAAGALASLLAVAGGNGVDAAALPFAAGLVAATASYAGRDRVGAWLFPNVEDAPDYVRQRKLDVYRACLEAAARSPTPRADAELRRMRRRLGLSEREHDVMQFMVTRMAPAQAQAEPARAKPGRRIAERYRIERVLGEGAHGRALLAFDEALDREVVLKVVGAAVLGGRGARMLLREARITMTIDHPNVVRVHDVLETPDEVMLVMEHAAGGSLQGLLKRRQAIPFADALKLLDQILAGLGAAHAAGVVHRDVKPSNVLLDAHGAAKLADFGVARDNDRELTGVTAGAAGTLLYMAPEQIRGGGTLVDHRADLYAAGVLLHELLTGRYYLRIAGCDDFQIRRLILEAPPRLEIKGEAEVARSAIERALAKDPADRFPSAAAMRAALDAIAPRSPGSGKRDTHTARGATTTPGRR